MVRSLLAVGVVLGALAVSGCFPEYQVGESGGGSGDGPVYIGVTGATFDYSLAETPFSVRFTHAFVVDRQEVTVGRFQAWLDAGTPVPCESETCSLDPGGPYQESMQWDSAWNERATAQHFASENDVHGDCSAPFPHTAPPTYARSQNYDFPMTCVSWFQAAAFCRWEGNRLLTQAEWMYVATGHGTRKTRFPWGDEAPTCSRATVQGCNFPKDVGDDTHDGHSLDGVQDLTGNVYEWVWDARWSYGASPEDSPDYAGPKASLPADQIERVRRGGAFINEPGDDDLRNDRENAHPAMEFYADAGFRCARSDLQQ
jgi:formylglycine-generating enzyme required for sulfatase activity